MAEPGSREKGEKMKEKGARSGENRGGEPGAAALAACVPPGRWGRRGVLLLLVSCLLALQVGCAGREQRQYEEVYRDKTVRVRLARTRNEEGKVVPMGFEHPWGVSQAELEGILRAVRYRKGAGLIKSKRLREAFPEVSRRALIPPLQQAFAQAGPDQMVDFSFYTVSRSLKLFRRVYYTDGIMFRKGGRLNIAFRNLSVESLADEEGNDYDLNREDPTERPIRTDWTLVPGEGQVLARNEAGGLFSRKSFPNWIQVDLSRSWTVATQGTPAVEGVPEESLPPLPAAEVPARALSPSEKAAYQERMQFLEELRRKGLITESAYEEERKALRRRYGMPAPSKSPEGGPATPPTSP